MQTYDDVSTGRDSIEVLRRVLGEDAEALADALAAQLETDGDGAEWRAIDRILPRLRSGVGRILMAGEVIAAAEPPDVSPDRARAAGTAIVAQASSLAALLDDLGEVSRVGSRRLELHLQPVDIVPIVRDAVWAHAHSAVDRDVLLDGPLHADGLPPILGDPPHVRRALRALLDNAVNHTPRRGHAWVELSARDDVVCVAVWDSGPGVDMADLPRLLQPFEQGAGAPGHGAGLGLAIAQGLLELHGGHLEVASWEGVGSRFTAVFRAAPEELRRR